MELARAFIEVKRRGRFRYSAMVIGRPEKLVDTPFEMPIMEQGPYHGRSHKKAWQKAWAAVGHPSIVEVDEL